MKTRKILVGLTVVLILLALGFVSESIRLENEREIGESAVKFNNEIVNSQASISEKIRTLDDNLSTIDRKEEAILLIDEVLVEVNSEIENIQTIESPQTSNSFKNSTIRLFEYYKSVLEIEYKQKLIPLFYDEIKTLTIEQFSAKNNLILGEINANIIKQTDEFITEQKKFAEEFHLELED